MAISDYNTSASLNTNVLGIYTGTNMERSDVDNSMRQIMADIAAHKNGITNPINVKDPPFNAVGDGVADDTTAINNALAYAVDNYVGLYFPAGTYKVTSLAVSLTDNALLSTLQLRGDGRRATKIVKSGAGTTPLLSITGAIVTGNIDIRDMEMTGLGDADGISLTGIAVFGLTRVMLNGFNNALELNGSLKGIIEDCDLNGSDVGLYARSATITGSVISPNAVTVDNCRFTANAGFGIDFGDGGMLRVVDSSIEGNGTSANTGTGGVILRSTIGLDTTYSNIVFSGCHIENNMGRAFQIEALAASRVAHVYFDTVAFIASESGRAFYSAADPDLTVMFANSYASSPGDTWEVNAGRLFLAGCTINTLSGTRTVASDVIISSTLGASPVEGNWQSALHQGGANLLRQSWADGTAWYQWKPNASTGNYDLTNTGGTAMVNAASVGFKLSYIIFNAPPGDHADDAAAAAAGLPVGKVYRTGSTLKVRVS